MGSRCGYGIDSGSGSSVPVDGFDVGNDGDLRSSSDRNMCVMDGCANEL